MAWKISQFITQGANYNHADAWRKFRCAMMENCHTVTFTAYESGVGIIKDYITFISRAKTRSGLIMVAEFLAIKEKLN